MPLIAERQGSWTMPWRSKVWLSARSEGPRSGPGLKLPGPARDAGFEGQVGGPDAEDVPYRPMLIVRLNDDIAGNFPLNTGMKASRERCSEAGLDSNGYRVNLRNSEVR